MKTRKNHIHGLLIVGALATIGTSAAGTYAKDISMPIAAQLHHPALATRILLNGTCNVTIMDSTVTFGNFYMVSPKAKAWIKWSPTRIDPHGNIKTYGSGRAKFTNPTTGAIEYVSFRMYCHGSIWHNSGRVVKLVSGSFRTVSSSVPRANLKGTYPPLP